MNTIFAFIITFFVGFAFKAKGCSQNKALAVASLIMPSFILITKYILLYKVGGAPMWPIALIFGTIYGTIVGGLGVVAGAFFLRWQSRISNKSK